MKAIICGGRNFNPTDFKEKYPNFEKEILDIFKENNIDEEVCGLAAGADKYGKYLAENNGIHVKEFPADWKGTEFPDDPCKMLDGPFGKPYNVLAGNNRNKRMGDYVKNNGGGITIALPGGNGTLHMMKYSLSLGLKVYRFDENIGHFKFISHIEEGDKI